MGTASANAAAVLVAVAMFASPAARAEGQSNEMRAEALFRSGEKKFDAGQHAQACQDFEASLKLAPKLGTLLNVALCHETVGKVATAWREFQHAAAWAAQNNQKDRHEFALQHVVALEPKLPRVALQLPVDRAIAALEVDGEPLPEQRWNLPVYLDPGEHAIAVTAPGKRRGSVTFRVVSSPTEQIVVVPSLDDAPPAAPAPKEAEPPPPASPLTRNVGWGLLAAGGAGVVTGVVLGVASAVKRGDADDHCANNVCDAEGIDALRGAQSLGTASLVVLTVGVLLGATGGVLLHTSTRTRRAPGPNVGLSPLRSGALVGLSGSF
jgi:hypothetical protein